MNPTDFIEVDSTTLYSSLDICMRFLTKNPGAIVKSQREVQSTGKQAYWNGRTSDNGTGLKHGIFDSTGSRTYPLSCVLTRSGFQSHSDQGCSAVQQRFIKHLLCSMPETLCFTPIISFNSYNSFIQ